MLLSAASFLVVAQSSSEVPEGLMNNPVFVILTAIGIMVTVFWHAMSFILVDTYQYFRETCVLNSRYFSTVKMEV